MKTLLPPVLTPPRVTVGMPVYRNAGTVERAIASVREQVFKDWRLIVTDDGSDDGTLAVAEAAAGEDARIEVRRNPERLGFENFAVALRTAETPYFVWLAGDDYWAPEFLERTVAALDAAPGAVSALPEAAFVGGGGKPVPNLGFLKGQASERVRHYLAHPGGTRMYGLMRTDAAQASFPKAPGNAYDWYLMVALLARGPQLSLPGRLLFREETGWIGYARSADSAFPILRTSQALVRSRQVPLGALPALAALNLRKHEEYLAVNRPQTFLRGSGVFRRLGLPISGRADKLAELAAWHRGQGSEAVAEAFEVMAARRRAAAPVVRSDAASVTAIVTCRNAESTIGSWLDHMAGLGCRVVFVDHGSTDRTREIAAGRPEIVTRIVDVPFDGRFDLTAQLDLKRKIIAGLPGGWVIHGDADEFLAMPEGMTLADVAAEAEAAGAVAVACDEMLYLPRFEDEVHTHGSFRETMTESVKMREHDEKQRLFRHDAPLDLWTATGGHSVTRDPGAVSKRRLRLDHYIGLSLDDLRGQYLTRVFARRDRVKQWHGTRAAARHFEIVPPDITLFEGPPAQVRELPVFRSFQPEAAVPAGPVDLAVFAGDATRARAALDRACPGLRLFVSETGEAPPGVPVLNLLSHPARIHDLDLSRSAERALATAWARRVAGGRQSALDRGVPYAEARLEDIEDVVLAEHIRGLFLAPLLTGSAEFVGPDSHPVEVRPYATPVRDITRALAADLGYI